jgi:Fic family protein
MGQRCPGSSHANGGGRESQQTVSPRVRPELPSGGGGESAGEADRALPPSATNSTGANARGLAGSPRADSWKLLNYREAFHLVSEYLDSGEPITEGLIREIHKRLVVDVRGGQGGPGAYRTVQNYVANSRTREILYTPPPPQEVPPLMRELVAWLGAETTIHPVLVAGIAQYQLVYIHPFLDGNGRTSRLLSTLCLYRAGYDFKRLFSISEFYDRDRPAFYAAIQSVRAHDMDLTGWMEFFIQGLATQVTF